jgi:cardiolipin synthase
MNHSIQEEYKLYNDPMKFYNAMLNDIEKASSYIYLETYRFNNDSIGIKFRDALTRKSKEGVEVKVLADSWGTSLPSNFFKELKENGGEVRYFLKLKFFWDFFTKNHRRNHRKILLIDDEISYIGSANLTDYSLNWRESVLRLKSQIALPLKRAFLKHYEIYNKYVFEKIAKDKKLGFGSFEIIRDVPSLTRQRIRKRYLELLRDAKKSVIIETPYFLPSSMVRKALRDAAERGVEVKIVMPKHSDVGLIDILRSRYLGYLHESGVDLRFYIPYNLHAKLMLIDNEIFALGSPNFDYRSFRYQHEIVLVGRESSIVSQIQEHVVGTLSASEGFNYDKWLRRSRFQRLGEWVIMPFRHLL